jgi:hypothetical protein
MFYLLTVPAVSRISSMHCCPSTSTCFRYESSIVGSYFSTKMPWNKANKTNHSFQLILIKPVIFGYRGNQLPMPKLWSSWHQYSRRPGWFIGYSWAKIGLPTHCCPSLSTFYWLAMPRSAEESIGFSWRVPETMVLDKKNSSLASTYSKTPNLLLIKLYKSNSAINNGTGEISPFN